MNLDVKVLFGKPQREIASVIRERLSRCSSVSIVVGYLTEAGLKTIDGTLHSHPKKLHRLVIGSGTIGAFKGCDRLIEAGVDPARLHVDLGFGAKSNAAPGFYKYRPMLHSKILLMNMDNGSSTAFVGSHNLTEFALTGLNSEMSICLEGPSSTPEFLEIRRHIAECVRRATVYQTSMKDAYAWWALQFINGLRQQFNDIPKDYISRKTILLLAEYKGSRLPTEGDVVFFEIPEGIGSIRSLTSQFHLFVFDTLPATPIDTRRNLRKARQSFNCEAVGLEDQGGGVELLADWQIKNALKKPVLKGTSRPFRPSTNRNMQQVRVEIKSKLTERFEYLFDVEKATWIPQFDDEELVHMPKADQALLNGLSIKPPTDLEWRKVRKLVRTKEDNLPKNYQQALGEMSPKSGSYSLMSLRRRKIAIQSDND